VLCPGPLLPAVGHRDGHLGKGAVVLVPDSPGLADHLVVVAVGGDRDERFVVAMVDLGQPA
jgi:hypothetical protein